MPTFDARMAHTSDPTAVVTRPPHSPLAPRHPAVARRLQRAASAARLPLVAFWVIAAVGVIALAVVARPAGAQWSIAPVLAIGAGVPADAGDNLNEGFSAKAGLWLRSPSIPFGITLEGVYARLGSTRTPEANAGVQIGGASINLTTRRHDGRFDTYLVGGVGYYWYSGRDGRLQSSDGPGFNAGLGETFDVGGHDLFAELRYHRVRVTDPLSDRWMSFVPLVFGIRF